MAGIGFGVEVGHEQLLKELRLRSRRMMLTGDAFHDDSRFLKAEIDPTTKLRDSASRYSLPSTFSFHDALADSRSV